jgi:hypothetical protein
MATGSRQPTNDAHRTSEKLTSEQLTRIQLLRTPNVGPISFFQLLAPIWFSRCGRVRPCPIWSVLPDARA